MSRRPLSDAEAALWKRVIATCEPFKDQANKNKATAKPSPLAAPLPAASPSGSPMAATPGMSGSGNVPAGRATAGKPVSAAPGARPVVKTDPARLWDGAAAKPAKAPGWTFTPVARPDVAGNLDGHWDRRIAKGGVQPDVTIDLHGHTLASAYARLDMALGQAKAADMRLMLLITGKARAADSGRGAIRGAVADWLASSRHAGDIAAVRNAHPRHGGDGALYIVLRRRRD